MSTIKTNAILDASGGNTTTINGTTPTAYNTMGKNRIINGAMEIDQRNAGASVAFTSAAYKLDRWVGAITSGSGHTIQKSSTAPQGQTSSAFITVSTGASPSAGSVNRLYQVIEGYNIADLNWGTASAATVTLSFWVRSSVTGTFSGALYGASTIQSYPFTYTISSANTFEQKTVTISGPTTGTWDSTNGAGIYVNFDLGSGTTFKTTAGSWATGTYIGVTGATNLCETSSATFYITGVQLEVGSVATEFERRPYGMELALCQRYYEHIYFGGTAGARWTARDYTGGISFAVTKRSTPTLTYSGTINLMNDSSLQGGITLQGWSTSVSGAGVRAIGSTVNNGASSIISPGSNPIIMVSSEL